MGLRVFARIGAHARLPIHEDNIASERRCVGAPLQLVRAWRAPRTLSHVVSLPCSTDTRHDLGLLSVLWRTMQRGGHGAVVSRTPLCAPRPAHVRGIAMVE